MNFLYCQIRFCHHFWPWSHWVIHSWKSSGIIWWSTGAELLLVLPDLLLTLLCYALLCGVISCLLAFDAIKDFQSWVFCKLHFKPIYSNWHKEKKKLTGCCSEMHIYYNFFLELCSSKWNISRSFSLLIFHTFSTCILSVFHTFTNGLFRIFICVLDFFLLRSFLHHLRLSFIKKWLIWEFFIHF